MGWGFMWRSLLRRGVLPRQAPMKTAPRIVSDREAGGFVRKDAVAIRQRSDSPAGSASVRLSARRIIGEPFRYPLYRLSRGKSKANSLAATFAAESPNKKGDARVEGDSGVAVFCRIPFRRWRETCESRGAADQIFTSSEL